MDIHDLFVASELMSVDSGGSTGETYTKSEIDILLSKKVDSTDIISNETIDLITAE